MSIATQKTLDKLRHDLWEPWIVERFLKSGPIGNGIRRDFFHIIDVVGMNPAKGLIGIQSTTTQRTSHLYTLLIDEAKHSRDWLECGQGRTFLELWCWRKLTPKKKDGTYSKKKIYCPKIDVITIDIIDEANRRYKENGERDFDFSWLKPCG